MSLPPHHWAGRAAISGPRQQSERRTSGRRLNPMGQRSPRPSWSSRIRLTSYFTAKNVQKGRPVKYLDIIQSICLFQDHGITGLSEVSYSTRQSVSPVSTDRGTNFNSICSTLLLVLQGSNLLTKPKATNSGTHIWLNVIKYGSCVFVIFASCLLRCTKAVLAERHQALPSSSLKMLPQLPLMLQR